MSKYTYRSEQGIINTVTRSIMLGFLHAGVVAAVASILLCVYVWMASGGDYGRETVTLIMVGIGVIWLLSFSITYYVIDNEIDKVLWYLASQEKPKPNPPTPLPETKERFIPVYRNGEMVYIKAGKGGDSRE